MPVQQKARLLELLLSFDVIYVNTNLLHVVPDGTSKFWVTHLL